MNPIAQLDPVQLRKKRRTNSTSALKQVVIAGGTHGNERNGVYLAKYFMKNPKLVQRPSFKTVTLLTNPYAAKANTRYVEEDINRCFYLKDLVQPAKSNLERERAHALDKELGPKASMMPKSDFIFDLHNTTAATGVCLMLPPDDKFALEVGAYLADLDPSVRIVLWSNVPDWPMFASMGRSGMTFEVGPASWGCIAPAEFIQSKQLILSGLDYIEAHNQRITQLKRSPSSGQATTYKKIKVFQNMHYVKYPRDDDGELIGMIHPKLQWQDWKELKNGQPLFAMFDGSADRLFDSSKYESGAVYPFFINEAAYYEKDIAFMLARKVSVDVKIPISKSKI